MRRVVGRWSKSIAFLFEQIIRPKGHIFSEGISANFEILDFLLEGNYLLEGVPWPIASIKFFEIEFFQDCPSFVFIHILELKLLYRSCK